MAGITNRKKYRPKVKNVEKLQIYIEARKTEKL